MASASYDPHAALRIDACDPLALVEVSQQFIRLDLGLTPTPPLPTETEKSAPVAADRADWNAVANALGNVYQALCNNECNAALGALRSIERILSKRGISIQQPTMIPRAHPTELPIEVEFDYGQ